MIQGRAEQAHNYNLVDLSKWVMAIFVVALYGHPFVDISADWDYYTSGVLTRLAVPYFFMVSGFFLFSKMPIGKIYWERIKKYCIRLGKILIAWSIIYLPMAVYDIWHHADHWHRFQIILIHTVFQGTLSIHLWYLHASIVAAGTLYFFFSKGFTLKKIITLALLLYLIPVLTYSYHGFYEEYFSEIWIVKNIAAPIGKVFDVGGGWTIGLLYMSLGCFFAWHRAVYRVSYIFSLLVIALIAFGIESYLIREYFLVYPLDKGNIFSYVMILVVGALFLLSINVNLKDNPIYKHLREQSLFIYLVHPWFLFLGTGIAKKVLHIEEYHMGVFLVTVVLSIIAAEFLRKLSKYKRFSWLG